MISEFILEYTEFKSYFFCGQLIQTSFYPGILVSRTGEREIGSVSGRVGIYAVVLFHVSQTTTRVLQRTPSLILSQNPLVHT